MVVSAPGKRHAGDEKVTDMLLRWHALAVENACSGDSARAVGERCIEIRQRIACRYFEIVEDLGLQIDIGAEMAEIARQVAIGASVDYVASRGEYLMAKILAEALGFEFIDPASCIRFNADGSYAVGEELSRALDGKRAVVAGFYGSLPDGSIKTFPRGGSDITGALIAAAVGAKCCENWTDVSGLLMADPRIVANPKPIDVVTYPELRELSYMGANVFHEEAMFPVWDAGIPTVIRNTNRPEEPGTRIIPENGNAVLTGKISGIAGRKGFTVITIGKRMMDQIIGFGRRVLSVVEDNKISFEHMPGGIDTLSIIIDGKQLNGKTQKVVREIKEPQITKYKKLKPRYNNSTAARPCCYAQDFN